MKPKKMKLILLITSSIGLSILLYPVISQYWNSKVQSQVITDYDEMLKKKDTIDYDKLFQDGEIYNQKLSKLEFPLVQYKKISDYKDLLNVNNDGMMGYISIDKIKVQLPIYHGTSTGVLNTAVGHLEGTSLPIGGIGNHSVLSAHRGLPSAKLFTNLNKLEIGDIFVINILDRKLTYQVDKITIIEPNDIKELAINHQEDLVTLITCTPYGLNTHRLLVRGIRIENIIEKKLIVTSEAYQIDKILVALIISIPILLVLILYVMFKTVKKGL